MVSRTARMQPSGKGARLGVLLGLALALSLVCALPAAAGEGTVSLRVCTYNVLRFQGWPEDVAREQLGTAASRRLAHFTDVFGGLDCDLLAIQEGGSQQWIDRLAANMGMEALFLPSPAEFPGGILSRHPIVEARPRQVAERSWEVPFSRTFGAALVDVAGRPIWVVNLHAHPNREDLREQEAHVLADTLDELLAVAPSAIVMGDFNSEPGGPLHEVLVERGFVNAVEAAWGRTVSTVNSPEGGVSSASIDHIYLSADLAGHLVSARVVLEPGFMYPLMFGPDDWVHSDHLPVVAELEWVPAAASRQ